MWEYCPKSVSEITLWAFNFSMVLFAVSYSVRDMVWLRVIAVVAGVLGIPYFIFCGEVQWYPVFWNSLFTLINAVQVAWLLYERRPVHLSEEERRFHMLCFRGLVPREMAKLLTIAHWKDAGPGDQLVTKGESIGGLIMIYSGIVDVQNEGRIFAESRDGQCVGEMSFVTGMPPSADVVARTPVRYVFWDKDELNGMMESTDRIREVMQSVLGFDMAEKLTARSRLDTPVKRRVDAVTPTS